MKKLFISGLLMAGLFLGFCSSALAHVGYVTLTNGVSITNGGYNNYGWLNGTDAWLGDSHELEGGVFYNFHLNQAQYVNISFSAVSAGFDPAFSLYSGLLPALAHDDAAGDTLGSGSVIDAAPGDPSIAHYVIDFNTLTYTLNPQWDVPKADLCDTAHGCNITPDQWYADNYTPHNGYRDLLNYTSTGGLDSSGNPIHSYQGQFDALGDWSMANEDGEWSQIKFIAAVNNNVTPLLANHAPAASGRVSSYNSATENLTNLFLQPGDYTIAAGGAGCDYQAGQSGLSLLCTSSTLQGALTFSASSSQFPVSTPAAVPVPASGWLFGSVLAFLAANRKRVICI